MTEMMVNLSDYMNSNNRAWLYIMGIVFGIIMVVAGVYLIIDKRHSERDILIAKINKESNLELLREYTDKVRFCTIRYEAMMFENEQLKEEVAKLKKEKNIQEDKESVN